MNIPATYDEALDYLYALRRFGTKLGIENIRFLLDRLGKPDLACEYVHIAGTNGKGSTAAMLARILQQASLKVGLFTSPHLVEFSERIQVNSTQIAPRQVLSILQQVGRLAQEMAVNSVHRQPTFFEIVTAIAACHFAESKCDVVVWETGMGGRLDATNAVQSVVSVITKIAIDHTKWLGKDLCDIAREKAGIIHEGAPVFTSVVEPHLLELLRDTARMCHAPLTCVCPASLDIAGGLDSRIVYTSNSVGHGCYTINVDEIGVGSAAVGLRGRHQVENAALAAVVADWHLRRKSVKDRPALIMRGLAETIWPARCQVLCTEPVVVVDCAHNADGMRAFADTLSVMSAKPWTAILGIVTDKQPDEIARAIRSVCDEVWYLKPTTQRGLSGEEFRATISSDVIGSTPVRILGDARALIAELRDPVNRDRQFAVAGSCYLAGDILAAWKETRRELRTDDPVRKAEQ